MKMMGMGACGMWLDLDKGNYNIERPEEPFVVGGAANGFNNCGPV